MQNLPFDILLEIFSYFNISDFSKAARINTYFYTNCELLKVIKKRKNQNVKNVKMAPENIIGIRRVSIMIFNMSKEKKLIKPRRR